MLQAVLFAVLVAARCAAGKSLNQQCYAASLTQFDPQPVVSHQLGTSAFAQAFNPSWIQASAGTRGKSGLLVRAQNCTSTPGVCIGCTGTGEKASYLAFAELQNDDNSSTPQFKPIGSESIVLGPHDATDDKGTEDPRVAFDEATGTYHLMYTCYNSGKATNQSAVTLCQAISTNPSSSTGWQRLGPVGFGPDSKSGAMLIREEAPHYLYWGAGIIHMTTSNSLIKWASPGKPFITKTLWNNTNVESGPPPLMLSTGDYVFFHNSWNDGWPKESSPGYQPAWVILSGDDPSQIIARAPEPLFSPQKASWMAGKAPSDCNMPTVAFLEAAHPTDKPDSFRVYFGGSDAVVGSAIVSFSQTGHVCDGSLP